MNYVSWSKLREDIHSFCAKLPPIVGVVGVPRSGTLIANMIGLHMNIPVADINHFENTGSFWGNGPRMTSVGHPPSGNLLLIDDSALTGKSLNDACSKLGGDLHKPFKLYEFNIIPAALYCQPDLAKKGLRHERIIPGPRVFAWNWYKHGLTKNSMWDFDGILCYDPTVAEDNEAGYINDIKSVLPLYIPSWPLRAICSNRLSKRRSICVDWLTRHGVSPVPELILRPENSCHERRKNGQGGEWKGEKYKADKESYLFVESCPKQASMIFQVSKKPVLCPLLDKMYK